MISIVAVGDIVPGGLLHYQCKYISEDLLRYLKSFDLRVGTLESPIGDNIGFDEEKMKGAKNLIYSKNRDALRLSEMDINVVSLANNHIFDLGEEGLANTITLLDQMGIKHCGAGRNIEEALCPAVVEVDGLSIAFVGCCMRHPEWLGYVKFADPESAGVYELDMNKLRLQIAELKNRYNMVFVMPHWGCEYYFLPAPGLLYMAEQIIEAGADGVIGSHPHVVNPVLRYKGKPVFFSMGNFLFPDFIVKPPRPIWYPERYNESEAYDTVYSFPRVVERSSVSKWIDPARIGLCGVIRINTQSDLTWNSFFVRLSNDNVLCKYSDWLIEVKHFWGRFFIKKTSLYGVPWKLSASGKNVFSIIGCKIIRSILKR